jgi:hypothetical protein
MKKKTTDRYFYPLETEIETTETGEGATYEEIAKYCGVLNKTNNNYNKKLIKKIAETYKLIPSGYIETEVYNRSNSSPYGYHTNQKPKYNEKDIQLIKKVISDTNVPDPKGLYTFKKVAFRKDFSVKINL